jgi:hypothetical protein
LEYELTYADTVEEGAALADTLSRLADRSGRLDLGFDTEFYGVELGKHSVLGRAKVHFASLAWEQGGEKFHPRGYTIPRAAVVSSKVVRECDGFRRLFNDPRVYTYAHNAPVDAHVFKNEGIDIANVINTLTMARWCWPGRARAAWGGGGFGLDALSKDVLGEGKLESFTELFTETVETWVTRVVTQKRCACGTPGCRKRSAGHEKYPDCWEERESKLEVRKVPLELVVPGHPLFERAKWYAAQDAVLAYCLREVMEREMRKQIRVVPWLSPKKAS